MKILKSTALYGKSFERTENVGVYFLRVYTGGFAGVRTATKRAMKEAESFLGGAGYLNFHILESKRVWLPFSCVDFLIDFRSRPKHREAEQVETQQPPLAALSSTSSVV